MVNDIQANIMLGQAQNQAIELIKAGLTTGELNLVAFLESPDFSKTYDKSVEILLQHNKSQHERLVQGIQSQPKTAQPTTQSASGTKPCPQCNESLPSTWMYHAKCGWKGTK